MNILVEQLPSAVMVDGREYPIETDFRACLRVIMAFEDDELTPTEKQMVLLQNMYPTRPHNLIAACEKAVKFLNGGKTAGEEGKSGPRLYSFAKDANLIFAAFKQTHGMDLAEVERLHWCKFLALFMDLGGETAFCNLVSLRKRLKNGTATKEERKIADDMGELIDVPQSDTRTPEEREMEERFWRLEAARQEVTNGG